METSRGSSTSLSTAGSVSSEEGGIETNEKNFKGSQDATVSISAHHQQVGHNKNGGAGKVTGAIQQPGFEPSRVSKSPNSSLQSTALDDTRM